MTKIAIFAAIIIGGYLLGSVPFGLLLGKLYGVDVSDESEDPSLGAQHSKYVGSPGLATAIFPDVDPVEFAQQQSEGH